MNMKHHPIKHIIHMILCCGLPILIIAVLPFVAKFSPAVATLLGVIAPFICPIIMGIMVFVMLRGKKKGSCCDDTNKKMDKSEISTK